MNDLQGFVSTQNIHKYIYHLGLFRQNFNNLEYFLRLYLNKKSGKDNIYAQRFINLSQGEVCEKNDITDRKTFSELCKEFNSYQNKNDTIDFDEFISFRDALAHGRVSSDSIGRMTVIKYSKPKNNQVMVEYKKILKIEDMQKMADKIGEVYMTISLRG